MRASLTKGLIPFARRNASTYYVLAQPYSYICSKQ